MTVPRYTAANSTETTTIRPKAQSGPEPALRDGIARAIKNVTQPAIREARMYLHMTAITEEILSCIGFPAYHSAGSVIIQYEATQATAIPSACHRSPTNRKTVVTIKS